MVTPRASITPVSPTSFNAAARSSSLACSRHSRAETRRIPMHPSCPHVGHSTLLCSAISHPGRTPVHIQRAQTQLHSSAPRRLMPRPIAASATQPPDGSHQPVTDTRTSRASSRLSCAPWPQRRTTMTDGNCDAEMSHRSLPTLPGAAVRPTMPEMITERPASGTGDELARALIVP